MNNSDKDGRPGILVMLLLPQRLNLRVKQKLRKRVEVDQKPLRERRRKIDMRMALAPS